MKTEHLDYLLEVIKCRSINKASKKLHLNHQYLSQIISAVEEECGVKLVERTRLGIELTEAGRQALPQMEAISRQFHALLASFQPVLADKQLTGELKFYCLSSLNPQLIGRIIHLLQAQYPGVDILLQEMSCQAVLERVKEEKNAIGQVLTSPQVPQLQLAPADSVELIPLRERPIVAWVAEDSPLRKKYDSITLKSLLKYNVVLYAPEGKEESAPYKIMRSIISSPPIKCVTNNLSTFYQLMTGENAIAVGTKHSFDGGMGRLAMIPVRDNIKVAVALVVNDESRQLPYVQTFIEICQELYMTQD